MFSSGTCKTVNTFYLKSPNSPWLDRNILAFFRWYLLLEQLKSHTPEGKICWDLAFSVSLKNAVNNDNTLLQDANCYRLFEGGRDRNQENLPVYFGTWLAKFFNSFVDSISKMLGTEHQWGWKICEVLPEINMKWGDELRQNLAC